MPLTNTSIGDDIQNICIATATMILNAMHYSLAGIIRLRVGSIKPVQAMHHIYYGITV